MSDKVLGFRVSTKRAIRGGVFKKTANQADYIIVVRGKFSGAVVTGHTSLRGQGYIRTIEALFLWRKGSPSVVDYHPVDREDTEECSRNRFENRRQWCSVKAGTKGVY